MAEPGIDFNAEAQRAQRTQRFFGVVAVLSWLLSVRNVYPKRICVVGHINLALCPPRLCVEKEVAHG